MAEITISARGLTVQRGPRTVLDALSFDVHGGEVLAVLGPNGAGKTTLLRALAGLCPHLGAIHLGPDRLDALAPEQRARRVTFVPQESELRAALAVREVVALGRYARSTFARSASADAAEVARALAATDVEALADRPFTDLSSGEKKRVLIARALATDAPILLLDEPTATLDVEHALRLFALLADVAKGGRTVIVVLHQLEQALEFAHTALLLERGAQVARGPVREVITAEHVRAVYRVSLIPGGAPGFRLLGETP